MVRYVWGRQIIKPSGYAFLEGKAVPLGRTQCPGCGCRLLRTTHILKWPVKEVEPAAIDRICAAPAYHKPFRNPAFEGKAANPGEAG